MNHFSPQSQTADTIGKNGSSAVAVASISVGGNSELSALSVCSTFSPFVVPTDSHISINSIVGFGYQDKAWMLRNTVIAGRRTKFP
jgi:hypothetical protein